MTGFRVNPLAAGQSGQSGQSAQSGQSGQFGQSAQSGQFRWSDSTEPPVQSTIAALVSAGLSPEKLAWPSEAWVVPHAERDALLESEFVVNGAVYVQNPSSMVPVSMLDPQPGERVLDLTAAPGSKTLQIAARMECRGELAAVEISRKRMYRMKAVLKQFGAGEFVRVFLQDGTRVWRYRPDHFDRILLDAPCSSEGRFHQSRPKSTSYWSMRKVRDMAHRQRNLIASAIKCLRPGGCLVYATCTTAPEENEGVVSWALKEFSGEVTVEPVELISRAFAHEGAVSVATEPAATSGGDEAINDLFAPPVLRWDGESFDPRVAGTIRISPNDRYQSFFVAKLRKI